MRISDWSSDVCSSDLLLLALMLAWLRLYSASIWPCVLAHAVNNVLAVARSEEHTSELQSLMRISYAVFCLKKKINKTVSNTLKKRYNIKHDQIKSEETKTEQLSHTEHID